MNRLTKNEVSASTLRAWRADAANLIESGVATSMISVCPVALSALCHEVLERRIVEPECSQCLGSRKVIVIRHGDEISIPCPKCSTVKGSEPADPGCPAMAGAQVVAECHEEIDRLRAELDEAKRAVAMWQAIHGNKPNAVEPSIVCEDCANGTPRSADGQRHESTSGIWACRNPVKITGTLKG